MEYHSKRSRTSIWDPDYGRAAATPIFGVGGWKDASIRVISEFPLDSPNAVFIFVPVSFPVLLERCCCPCCLESGEGCDSRKTLKEGGGTAVGCFTMRCSFSSPGTRCPVDTASVFQWRHGSPPATSISSLSIVVDHFSCISRILCVPLPSTDVTR